MDLPHLAVGLVRVRFQLVGLRARGVERRSCLRATFTPDTGIRCRLAQPARLGDYVIYIYVYIDIDIDIDIYIEREIDQ